MRESVSGMYDKEVYLKENRYENTKESFKVLANLLKDSGVVREGCVIRDIGCAAGEFLYHLSTKFPEARLYGYDIVPELLEKARHHVPAAKFALGSVLDQSAIPAKSSDVLFLLGVHKIFDDLEPWLPNLLYWTRDGGRIYVHGLFNPYPLDVWVTYRRADRPDLIGREPAWNIISMETVSRYLDQAIGKGKYRFLPFEMPFDLAPDPDDAVRTWTFADGQGRRLITNGLSLLCPLWNLEISL